MTQARAWKVSPACALVGDDVVAVMLSEPTVGADDSKSTGGGTAHAVAWLQSATWMASLEKARSAQAQQEHLV